MSERNVPEVRFKGFCGEWEKKNLESQVDFYSGLTYSPQNIVDDGGTLVLRSSNVKSGEVVDADNVYVDSSAVNCQNVKLGDIIVVVRNGSRALIGKHGQIKAEMQDTVIGAFMTGVQSKQPDFINALLDTVQFSKEIEKNLGATINQITTGSFKKMSFFFTEDTDEQTKIGEFFKNLDNLIAQNQKKYDKLVNMKKACLDKMFPKDGADTPEVRFKGFSGKWERCNWEDKVDISTNMVDPRTGEFDELPHIGPGNIEAFSGKLISNVKSVREDCLISGKFHFYKGEIIYGKINPQLGKYVIAPYEGLSSADTYILNSKNGIEQLFLFSILQTKDFFKYTVSVSMRSGMPKINRDELNAYNFTAPSYAEQAKIGTFFQTLDTLITLQKTKLEKLKNIKKALLDKMFI